MQHHVNDTLADSSFRRILLIIVPSNPMGPTPPVDTVSGLADSTGVGPDSTSREGYSWSPLTKNTQQQMLVIYSLLS